ncbi:hypothetical protein D9758_016504 [Tetrapyrgos nigripes]|uniref:Uncharacterized protein n=1 Tax=Tetrapyrgos nigripes TaxID=182062 RepID=A0A8H5CL52_9AGAR|nr:hypothetical protein D9758_016504 [Tetrapyrgos nigripes]
MAPHAQNPYIIKQKLDLVDSPDIINLAFSPRGDVLATGAMDGAVKLLFWEKAQIADAPTLASAVTAFCWSPNPDLLVLYMGERNGHVHYLEYQDGIGVVNHHLLKEMTDPVAAINIVENELLFIGTGPSVIVYRQDKGQSPFKQIREELTCSAGRVGQRLNSLKPQQDANDAIVTGIKAKRRDGKIVVVVGYLKHGLQAFSVVWKPDVNIMYFEPLWQTRETEGRLLPTWDLYKNTTRTSLVAYHLDHGLEYYDTDPVGETGFAEFQGYQPTENRGRQAFPVAFLLQGQHVIYGSFGGEAIVVNTDDTEPKRTVQILNRSPTNIQTSCVIALAAWSDEKHGSERVALGKIGGGTTIIIYELSARLHTTPHPARISLESYKHGNSSVSPEPATPTPARQSKSAMTTPQNATRSGGSTLRAGEPSEYGDSEASAPATLPVHGSTSARVSSSHTRKRSTWKMQKSVAAQGQTPTPVTATLKPPLSTSHPLTSSQLGPELPSGAVSAAETREEQPSWPSSVLRLVTTAFRYLAIIIVCCLLASYIWALISANPQQPAPPLLSASVTATSTAEEEQHNSHYRHSSVKTLAVGSDWLTKSATADASLTETQFAHTISTSITPSTCNTASLSRSDGADGTLLAKTQAHVATLPTEHIVATITSTVTAVVTQTTDPMDLDAALRRVEWGKTVAQGIEHLGIEMKQGMERLSRSNAWIFGLFVVVMGVNVYGIIGLVQAISAPLTTFVIWVPSKAVSILFISLMKVFWIVWKRFWERYEELKEEERTEEEDERRTQGEERGNEEERDAMAWTSVYSGSSPKGEISTGTSSFGE